MKSTSARNVLGEFFQVEETASGYIARCPECAVRFAVNVKYDVVVDDYVALLLEHATEERITFEQDDDIRDWLEHDLSQGNAFLDALEQAAKRAGQKEYKVLRPVLCAMKSRKASAASSEATGSEAMALSHRRGRKAHAARTDE